MKVVAWVLAATMYSCFNAFYLVGSDEWEGAEQIRQVEDITCGECSMNAWDDNCCGICYDDTHSRTLGCCSYIVFQFKRWCCGNSQ